jgi:hypothetical protein
MQFAEEIVLIAAVCKAQTPKMPIAKMTEVIITSRMVKPSFFSIIVLMFASASVL